MITEKPKLEGILCCWKTMNNQVKQILRLSSNMNVLPKLLNVMNSTN
jgi:hypothetical protein